MRKTFVLLSCTALAACGGGGGAGPTTIGGSAVGDGSSSSSVAAGPGDGVTFASGTGTNGDATVGSADTFLKVSAATTFNVNGGLQSLSVDTTTGGELYQGDASTVRAPNGSIDYDPRDGIFTLTLSDTKAGVDSLYRYQDPAHRTEFTQDGTPNLDEFNYLEGIGSGSGNTTTTDRRTFFYQRPGASTTYVSLAGYVRNSIPEGSGTDVFERGAFVFGSPTATSQVPTSGTGTYTGGMLATMVDESRYFQWIAGTSSVSVDFGAGSVSLALNGTVGPTTYNNGVTVPDAALAVPTGASFTASGTAAIDLIKTGGFTGQFQSASFTSNGVTTPVQFTAPATGTSTAGASSIDGAFYGPNAVNVGGSFRIVGGVPDQRVDILGAFTGAKK